MKNIMIYMTTQRIHNLLAKFNLKFNLTSRVLNIEIKDDYDQYKIIQRNLAFIRSDGSLDYGTFDCYHFENDNSYCEIVPDCNLNQVLYFTKLNNKWVGYTFDELGRLSNRA